MSVEINRNLLADKMEKAGSFAAVLGFAGTIVSGIAFVATEPNLSAETIQRLSTNLNGFFEAAYFSAMVSGTGAVAARFSERIRKK